MNISALGTIRAEILADTRDLHKNIGAARTSIKGFGADVPKWVKPVSTAFLAAGTVITGALTKIVFDTAKYGDEMDKLAARTGLSVETWSKWSYAAEITGTNISTLENGFRFLSRAMDDVSKGVGEGKETFEKLGIEVVGADGNLRSVVEVLKDAAESINTLGSETEKTAAVTDLFGGRMGTRLLPLLREGREGIERLTDKAERLGLVMSTEAAKASAEFNDRMTELKETLKMASFDLGQTLLPALEGVVIKARDGVSWFTKLGDTEKKLVGWGTATAGGVALVTGGAGLLLIQVPKLIKGFTALNAASWKLKAGLATGAAGLALVVASGWAYFEIREALKESGTNTLENQIENQTEVFEMNLLAIAQVEQGLKRYASEGLDPTTATLGDLNIKSDLLSSALRSQGTSVTNAYELLAILQKKADDSGASVTALEKSTKEMNEAAGDLATTTGGLTGTLGEQPTVLKEISKAFSDHTAITGEGYKENELQLIAYLKAVKEGGIETVEEQRWVDNTISDLKLDQFKGALFLNAQGTKEHRGEIEKRSVLDENYIKKSRRYEVTRFEKSRDSRIKETGLIREGYDARIDGAEKAAEKAVDWLKWKLGRSREFLAEQAADSRKRVASEEALEGFYTNVVLGNIDKIKKAWVDASEKHIAAESIKLSKFESFLSQEIGSVRMQKELINREYEEMKELYSQYGEDLITLDSWRADEMLKIEQSLTDSKIEEIARYSSAFEERLMNDTKLAADYWGAVDLVTGKFDEQKYLESRKDAGGYVYQGMDPDYLKRLNEPLSLVALSTKETTAALKEMEGTEGTLEKASATLADELAGHSLTTAFYDVQESMRGFAIGMAENIESITGLSTLTEKAGAAIVQAESEKNAKLESLTADFIGGKIHSAAEAHGLMIAAEEEYQKKLRDIQTDSAQSFVDIQINMAKAAELLWTFRDEGNLRDPEFKILSQSIDTRAQPASFKEMFFPEQRQDLSKSLSLVSVEAEEEAKRFAAIARRDRIAKEAAALSGGLAGPLLPTASAYTSESMQRDPQAEPEPTPAPVTIQINVENLYGGDEEALNVFAEDIGRRIQDQNITI